MVPSLCVVVLSLCVEVISLRAGVFLLCCVVVSLCVAVPSLYVVQFLHYVVRFLRYVVSPLCVVVLPLCNVILFLAIRVYLRCQSLLPRSLSSLRTRLTGLLYKILCIACLFAFLPFGKKKIMEDILKELHLESLIPHFLAERIEPANVAALSDAELCHVGVTTIGNRLRLRDLCAVAEKGRTRESVASNVLQERMALFRGVQVIFSKTLCSSSSKSSLIFFTPRPA